MEGTAEKGRLEICFCNEDVFLKRKEVRGNAFKRKTWTIPGPGKSREVKKKKKKEWPHSNLGCRWVPSGMCRK